MHGKVRDAKKGGNKFIKFLSLCSKVSVRCILIDGNVFYEHAASIFYPENGSRMFLRKSKNVYQNVGRHIPESHDFDTAGRRRRLEDVLQGS
jgi:hypothetical protein